MKSIKEKAIEVFPRHCNANTDYSNFKKRIGFNSGANYVLDEVECILEEYKLSDCEEICNELIALIEQLKK